MINEEDLTKPISEENFKKLICSLQQNAIKELILNNDYIKYSWIQTPSEEQLIKIFQALSTNTSVQFLEIKLKMVETIAIQFANMLERNQSLQKIILSACEVSEESWVVIMTGLSKSKSIQSLKITSLLSDAAIEAIMKSQKLQKLDLYLLQESTMKAIADGLMHNNTLQELSLDFYNRIGNQCAATNIKFLSDSLLKNKTLKKLALIFIWRDAGLEALNKQLPNLLGNNSPLTHLNLESCYLREKSGVALAQGLIENQSLKTLNLKGTMLEDKAVYEIACALQKNTSLKLQFIDLTTALTGVSESVIKRFLTALKSQTSLQYINLSDMVRDKNKGLLNLAKEIVEILEANKSLQELNLSLTNLSSKGFNDISKALIKPNQTLNKLSVASNKLDKTAVKSLMELLMKNESLQELDLSGNHWSNNDLQLIANALEKNKTLTQIDLGVYRGTFSDEWEDYAESAVKYVIEKLKNNTSLLDIKIKRQGPDSPQLTALMERNKRCLKEACLMGLHPRLGKDSAILSFSKNPIFDRNVLNEVFSFVSLEDTPSRLPKVNIELYEENSDIVPSITK